MKTVGFPICHKENEKRRTVLPRHIMRMKNADKLCFEKGYGEVLGISDEEYRACGCHMISREETLDQDIICAPKIGDAEYIGRLQNQIIFGWVHATQNKELTDQLVQGKITAYAWEKMYDRGRHVFWKNNELAGEAAVLHAFQCYGKMPYEVKAAVLGRGNTARGAIKILNKLGASVTQYNRNTVELFKEELSKYDVVVICVLWDITRKEHIIYKSDLSEMKRGSMIIDVSCDKNGAVETSVPTTIDDPTYMVEGILHYVVDHTPAIFYKTFTYCNSEILYPYLDQLIEGKEDKVLQDAQIVREGKIIDPEIVKFQNR